MRRILGGLVAEAPVLMGVSLTNYLSVVGYAGPSVYGPRVFPSVGMGLDLRLARYLGLRPFATAGSPFGTPLSETRAGVSLWVGDGHDFSR